MRPIPPSNIGAKPPYHQNALITQIHVQSQFKKKEKKIYQMVCACGLDTTPWNTDSTVKKLYYGIEKRSKKKTSIKNCK